MKIPIYQIDAFTEKQFSGNPAAVCPLEKWLDNSVLQNIAAENNLPETAFFVDKGDYYELRWFTPETEIDLCGHATLASAYVINKYLHYSKKKIVFQSQSGKLEVEIDDELLSMYFPSRPAVPVQTPESLVEGLGIVPLDVMKSRDFLVIYENQEQIETLKPDLNTLKELDGFGIIVTAPGKEVDFVSRFFAPGAGISEDPVTGSSHCTLIPYWSERLGQKDMIARQLSSRGGKLYCSMLENNMVKISGSAVSYLEGYINI